MRWLLERLGAWFGNANGLTSSPREHLFIVICSGFEVNVVFLRLVSLVCVWMAVENWPRVVCFHSRDNPRRASRPIYWRNLDCCVAWPYVYINFDELYKIYTDQFYPVFTITAICIPRKSAGVCCGSLFRTINWYCRVSVVLIPGGVVCVCWVLTIIALQQHDAE